jgi:cytochrome c556
MLLSTLALAAIAALAACGPPKNYTPVEEVPKIKSLEALMDAQATAVDPQFGKMSQESFTDVEFKALGDAGVKIDATSKHIKSFSKGPEFDGFAMKLNEKAIALTKAASGKDAAGARTSLKEMKTVCKDCHSKFR